MWFTQLWWVKIMLVQGWCGANNILVSFIIFIALSLNMHLARSWALRGNLCKCQVVLFMTCTNPIPNNTIGHCNTWYGITRGGFQFFFCSFGIFASWWWLFTKRRLHEDTTKGDNVINIGGFLDKDDSGFFSYNDVNIDEVEGPSAPM
jgi:hypothetical protein